MKHLSKVVKKVSAATMVVAAITFGLPAASAAAAPPSRTHCDAHNRSLMQVKDLCFFVDGTGTATVWITNVTGFYGGSGKGYIVFSNNTTANFPWYNGIFWDREKTVTAIVVTDYY